MGPGRACPTCWGTATSACSVTGTPSAVVWRVARGCHGSLSIGSGRERRPCIVPEMPCLVRGCRLCRCWEGVARGVLCGAVFDAGGGDDGLCLAEVVLLVVMVAGRWVRAAVSFLCKLGLQGLQGIEELRVLLHQGELLALQPGDSEDLSRGVRGGMRSSGHRMLSAHTGQETRYAVLSSLFSYRASCWPGVGFPAACQRCLGTGLLPERQQGSNQRLQSGSE